MTEQDVYFEEPEFEEGEFGEPLCPECGSPALYATVMTRHTGVPLTMVAFDGFELDLMQGEEVEQEVEKIYCSDCEWEYVYVDYGKEGYDE